MFDSLPEPSFRGVDAESPSPATVLATTGDNLRRHLQIITTAHEVLAENLDGLERMALARAEQAGSELRRQLELLLGSLSSLNAPVELGPILARLESEFKGPAARYGIKLSVVGTETAVYSNGLLLSGILGNLVCNALAHTPRGRSV